MLTVADMGEGAGVKNHGKSADVLLTVPNRYVTFFYQIYSVSTLWVLPFSHHILKVNVFGG